MNKRLLSLLASVLLFLPFVVPGCRDAPSGPETDEIRLKFSINPGSLFSLNDTTSPAPLDLISFPGFNKENYRHVDSAVLMVLFWSNGTASFAENVARLYDCTNDVLIGNSRVATPASGSAWIVSENIWDDLPGGNVTLGLAVQGVVLDAYLVLY